MRYESVAASAMFACNASEMSEVSLDIFEAVRHERPEAVRASAYVLNGALGALRRQKRADAAGPSTKPAFVRDSASHSAHGVFAHRRQQDVATQGCPARGPASTAQLAAPPSARTENMKTW